MQYDCRLSVLTVHCRIQRSLGYPEENLFVCLTITVSNHWHNFDGKTKAHDNKQCYNMIYWIIKLNIH